MSFGRTHFVSKRPMDSCPTTDQLQKYQEKVENTVNGMSVKCARSPSAKQLVVTTPRTSRFYLQYTILTLVDPLSLTALFPRKTSHPIWMKSWRILSEALLPMLRTPTMLFTYLTHSDLTPQSWTTLSVR